MSLASSVRTTPEAYLASERQAAVRHEYLDGEIIEMVGSSWEHTTIVLNLVTFLKQRLKGSRFSVVALDMRVKAPATGLYTYPDVIIVEGERQFEDASVDTLLNPKVIIEVLSPSMERYDRGDKFEHYQSIDGFHEYVLIAQRESAVERFVRSDSGANSVADSGGWTHEVYRFPETSFELRSIPCHIPLDVIYEDIHFPPV
jgi:Uma2 family endonuclease